MEIYYIILILCNIAIQSYVFKEIYKLHKHDHIILRKISSDLICLQQKVNNLNCKFDSCSSLTSDSPKQPIKPNNWDSIREAFKGPVRVEVNERD